MECPFCEGNPDVEQWDEEIVDHLVMTIDEGGHLHVHGPTDDPKAMKRFVKVLEKYCGSPSKKTWGKKKLTAGNKEAQA